MSGFGIEVEGPPFGRRGMVVVLLLFFFERLKQGDLLVFVHCVRRKTP